MITITINTTPEQDAQIARDAAASGETIDQWSSRMFGKLVRGRADSLIAKRRETNRAAFGVAAVAAPVEKQREIARVLGLVEVDGEFRQPTVEAKIESPSLLVSPVIGA